MNLHTYQKAFDDMEPENQYEQRLLCCLEQQKKHRNPRLLRISVIAAVLILVVSGGVFAAASVDWNEAYRAFFHMESESVQGFVEYPPVEAQEVPTLQPVSCVTGIQTLKIRFAYGPMDREQAQRLMEQMDEDGVIPAQDALCVELEGLGYSEPIYCTIQAYDDVTGMALVEVSGWYDVLPEQVHIKLSLVQNQQELYGIGQALGTLTIEPEAPQVKTAVLNLITTGPDGQEGGIVSLKVDAGSYSWVEDIPGMTVWDNFEEALRDPEFSQYITDWDNLLLEEFMKDAYLTFADGTTRTLGAGVSCTWDGEHYCQWGGGVYDLGNLVSVTVAGKEYLFE